MKFFTADYHFSRTSNNVLSRPFPNGLEMSEYLLEQTLKITKRGDILYIAGDFAFEEKECRFWRNKFKCEIFLSRGNHDISLSKLQEIFGKYHVHDILETKCKETHAVICHYPMFYWPKSHYNSYMLHGHTHDMRTETILNVFPEIRLLDIGLDTAKRILGEYRPFSEDEIHDLLSIKKGHDPVEFYTNIHGTYRKDHND